MIMKEGSRNDEIFAISGVLLWTKDIVKVNIRRQHVCCPSVYLFIQRFNKIAYLIQDTLLPENCQISSKEGISYTQVHTSYPDLRTLIYIS